MMRTLLAVSGTAVVSLVAASVFEANAAGNVLLLVATALSINFTYWFGTKSRWKLLNAGRSLLYVSLSISLVLVQNSLSVWIGQEYFGRGVLRVFMYCSIAAAFVGMNWTLWRIQRRDPTVVLPGHVPRFLKNQCPDSEEEKEEEAII